MFFQIVTGWSVVVELKFPTTMSGRPVPNRSPTAHTTASQSTPASECRANLPSGVCSRSTTASALRAARSGNLSPGRKLTATMSIRPEPVIFPARALWTPYIGVTACRSYFMSPLFSSHCTPWYGLKRYGSSRMSPFEYRMSNLPSPFMSTN